MTSEASRALNFLCSAGPHANTTVTGEQVNEIMMSTGGSIIAQGRLVEIVSRQLGPDVWKLTRSDKP